jgi:hypothetical protein
MVASTFAPPRVAPLDAATSDLVLRVAGSSRDGQIVRLTSAKCTIGSGPRCTLRLRMPGVGPLHCLILRGQAGSVIRRLGADTRLNHQSFTDAVLSPGDRVGIGPIELEVVSVGVQTTPVDQAPSICQQPDQWQAEQVEAQRAELEAQQRALSEQRRQWEEQRNENAAQAAAQSRQLAVQATELELQRQSLDHERRQWQTEQAEAQQRLDREHNALAVQQTELESQRNVLSDDRRQWESQRAELAAQNEIQSQQLAVRVAQVESERQSLDGQRQQWQAEQAEAQRSLNQERDALNVAQAELEAQRNAFEEERRQWEAERREAPVAAEHGDEPTEAVAEAEQSEESAAQQLQFEEAAADSPVNLADVFRRLGAKVELEEDEDESKPSEPAAEISRPADSASQRPSAASRAAANKESDEESVDEYMARLMQRIRSVEDEPEARSPAPSYARRESSTAGSPVESPKPQVTQQREPLELLPRAAAPERKIDLSALRELANLSADAAINQHSRRVLIRTMVSKLLVSVVALLAGGGLLWMWKLPGAQQLTFYSGLLALLIAIYWGIEYALLTGRVIISKSGAIDWNSSPSGKNRSAAAKETAQKTLPENASQPVPDGREPGSVASTAGDSRT